MGVQSQVDHPFPSDGDPEQEPGEGATSVAVQTPGLIAPPSSGRSAKPIGEIVIELGFGSEEQVEAAVQRARESGRLTGRVLIEDGVLTSRQLAIVLSARFGVERLDLSHFDVDQDCLRLVDAAFVRRYDAIPVGTAPDGRLVLASADPANFMAVDDVALLTGRQIKPVVAGFDDIALLAQRLGGEWDRIEDLGAPAEETDRALDLNEELDVNELNANPDDAPVIKLVNGVLTKAIRRGASDIHFDPQADGLNITYRVDGMLDAVTQAPRRLTAAVVSRLKIMGSIDIAERRRPQDGRTAILIDDRQIDLRIVTLPTVFGEAVVCRVLDSTAAPTSLESVGLLDDDRAKIEATLARPYGGFLVCGPTGSGKSTTLYSGLGHVNTGDKTIITIEDPVEYRLDGVKQMAINPKANLTFANGLRAIMRADPDIIMVGEIRDSETAHIAIESALTGHMVLSTLHTRDAPNAVARLMDMGIEPFLLSSAVDCVLAQRLARRLCTNCRKAKIYTAQVLRDNGFDVHEDFEGFGPGGCDQCSNSGYRGRLGVFQLLMVDHGIRDLILRRASADEIEAAARAAGMRTLSEDGLEKVRLGWTSAEEITRVTASA